MTVTKRAFLFDPIHGIAANRPRLTRLFATAAAASFAAVLVGSLRGWPAWVLAVAGILPWLPAFAADAAWLGRRSVGLALLYVLAVSQGGHLLEHVAQMVQIHLMGLSGPQARGVVGQLDVEWVHFAWNTWVVAAAAVLFWRFPRNRWLIALAVAAVLHESEHVYLMLVYLSTGAAGTPGLLAAGGAVGGGLPLTRPDLHFLYNLVETVPLFVALGIELRRTLGRRTGGPGDPVAVRAAAPGTAPTPVEVRP
jgi:hypothetical protein